MTTTPGTPSSYYPTDPWARPPRAGWRRFSQRWYYWPLLGVALFVTSLMLLTPLYLFVRAAASGSAAVELLLRPNTLATLGRTSLLTATVTFSATLIAIPLAWLTASTDLPGRRFWSVTAALPLVIPSYVAAYLFVSVFGPRGVMQQALIPLLGGAALPSIYGFPGACLVLTLISYPYTYLSVRAALLRLDPAQVEAARSLGLSSRQAFWRITMPQLRPSIVAGSLLVALYVLRDFGAVTMLRYNTFTRIIYIQYQSLFDRGLAAALGLVLVGLTVLILYLEWRSRGRARYQRLGSGAARRLQPVALGPWRWPALFFVGMVTTTSLLLPAGGLIYWLGRGLARSSGSINLANVAAAAFNSVQAALLAALLTTALALPIAVLAVRRPSFLSQLAERITYAGFALPGIVIALALVFFGANYLPILYQTLPLLLLAYVILFIPQAVGAARASLLQVSPSLEEAGRCLGQTPLGVFRRITLPLVRGGVLAGGALVFLTSMKELPATLLLSPIGFRTLATQVWSSIGEAFFAQAAVPTLLLILLSSVPLAIITIRERA